MLQEDGPKESFMTSWSRKYQYLLDKSSPHIAFRWCAYAVALFLYMLRVYLVNGWFIVTYGLGIYLLNQFIGFLSPQVFSRMLSYTNK